MLVLSRALPTCRSAKADKKKKQKKMFFLPAPLPPQKYTGQDPEAAAHEANCGLKQTHTDLR